MKLNNKGFIGAALLLLVGGIGVLMGMLAIQSAEFEQSILVRNECPKYVYGPLISGQLEASYWTLSTVQAQAAKLLFMKFPGAVWRVKGGLVEVLMDQGDGTQTWDNIGCDQTGQWLYLGCKIPKVMKSLPDGQDDQIMHDHLMWIKYGLEI